jgi:hypothetical protein
VVGGGGGGGVVVVSLVVVVEVDPEEVVGSSPDSAYWPWKACHTAAILGSVHWSTSDWPSADTMKSCQICAGNVPPATAIPCTLVISTRESG